jgi:hypothetical protein
MPTTAGSKTLFSLYSESDGYKLGAPQRVSEDSLVCVVPILRETDLDRNYVTLPEAQDKAKITDAGPVNELRISNPSKDNLYLRFSTVFAGAMQERTLIRSHVILAGAENVKLEVRCVHASKPTRAGAKATYAGYAPLEMDQKIYGRGFSTPSQQYVWSCVSSTTANYMARAQSARSSPSGSTERSSLTDTTREPRKASYQRSRASSNTTSVGTVTFTPYQSDVSLADARRLLTAALDKMSLGRNSDDLYSNIQAFNQTFEHVIRSVELQPHQAGYALVSNLGVETIESFDQEDSWRAIHSDAVKRIGTKLVDQKRKTFIFNPEVAHSEVRDVLSLDFEEKEIYRHKSNNGDPDIVITGLAATGYNGEVVEVGGRVIHLAILRSAVQ